ncbi:helix-turn-helix domain-containing protein [Acinetobacter seifertii]|uniref:Helix-turn-helix domain-containing protein n=1 Tax=Acinetobacter seifertii TaxID=1530123 RepID=A0A7H2NRH4_9GAMM|nr:helix-turn-helix domain-containing protein [Acinetobacter seifertii]MBZ6534084.1 helix-turn-helix domain-containing protein [Acinetobacter seifertii]QNW93206.1 helix-turn-helix domain-containing protein [Acinetobacter seifertii]QNX10378.1 helix-turn-helix domain-containing protein [Acinetobacter seifertii]QNX50408.1 helix-turn-helix domain-containing protein [Acinetobacter seifertii]QNX74085.1 helix-turn-helix domain-containing protein [Acinetobacter seifertii]
MPSIIQMGEQEFGYEIIRARRQMKISQAQLASKLGISIRTLESWERGIRHPSKPSQALIRLFIKSPEFVLKNLT